MKVIGIIIFFVIWVWIIFKDNIVKDDSESIEIKSTEKVLFQAFLQGKISAIDKEGKRHVIEDLLETDNGMYIFSDIDNDGEDELHIRSLRHYHTLKINGDTIDIIYDGAIYNRPVNENGLCGILYYRPGGAPKHDTYKFTTFGKNGEIIEELLFEWYDDNGNQLMDEKDFYYYNESEIEMEQWKNKAQIYINSKDNPLMWESWESSSIKYRSENMNREKERREQ